MKLKSDNDNAKREASYPLYDLAEAIKVAVAVRDLGGANVPVARGFLAKQLKYAETGPSFFQRIAAAKAFGIISGRGSYGLTDLAREYFYPITQNGGKAAAMKMLTFPKAFAALIKKFDGEKLPPIEMLGNIIHAEADIPVSKKNALAGCFIRSAKLIGAVDADGLVHCNAFVSAGNLAAVTRDSQPLSEAERVPFEKLPKEFSTQEENSVYLDKEKTKKVTLKCPLFLSRAEYDRICNWIKATWIIEEEKRTE